MTAGYVRLSRDEALKNYTSIENQKHIIQQYADENKITVDKWYEDLGESGYSFDRTAFKEMMSDLSEDSCGTIIIKDLSRLGRHNAKVLLCLEEMKEKGSRIIAIDDDYDSNEDESEIIGIKTWYNERYIKDTSKKIRRVLHMQQQDGTIITQVPFGYRRNRDNKLLIEIIEEQAELIRYIFEEYLNGNGFRKISDMLTNSGVPTPSKMQMDEYMTEGLHYQRQISERWNPSMIKNIIQNDFYIGNFRTRKRRRSTINGTDKKVNASEQLVFPNHHDSIIEKSIFRRAGEILQKRKKTNYRGNIKYENPFSGCLICKDCGKKLTAINRLNKERYYICSTYNKKGKQFCAHSHMVYESVLLDAVSVFIKYYMIRMSDQLSKMELREFKKNTLTEEDFEIKLKKELIKEKDTLKLLILQKTRELRENPDIDSVITNTYLSLQKETTEKIRELELKLKEFERQAISDSELCNEDCAPESAIDILNQLIYEKNYNTKDIELLIEQILVSSDGSLEINFRYGFVY